MVERKKGLNPNVLLGVIIFLVVAIAVMGFFLGRMSNKGGAGDNTTKYENLSIKVIKDDRDSSVNVNGIIEELKALPSVGSAKFTVVDFSDAGVKDYMIENGIRYLPAFIFSTNNFDVSKDQVQIGQDGNPAPKINYYLTVLPSGEYDLPFGSSYDPFVERSDRGFKLLTQEQFGKLSDVGSYVDGNRDSKIIWLEFSDLQCPFCAKLYSDETPTTIKAKYGDNISIIFNHFPLSFHPNAIPAAEVAECLATQKGASAFYALIEVAFKNNNILNGSDVAAAKKFMLDEAIKLGANKTTLETCVNANTYSAKIQNQMNVGAEVFGITGTPGNVLVNIDTLEYEILSGAYPANYFESIIDRLLAE